jgi:hypothetical protein
MRSKDNGLNLIVNLTSVMSRLSFGTLMAIFAQNHTS